MGAWRTRQAAAATHCHASAAATHRPATPRLQQPTTPMPRHPTTLRLRQPTATPRLQQPTTPPPHHASLCKPRVMPRLSVRALNTTPCPATHAFLPGRQGCAGAKEWAGQCCGAGRPHTARRAAARLPQSNARQMGWPALERDANFTTGERGEASTCRVAPPNIARSGGWVRSPI